MSVIGPNVIVAGFPRCGTTYFFNLINQHPDVFIPPGKELNFFNKDNYYLTDPTLPNPNFSKGIKWYKNHFISDKKCRIAFDILTALDITSAKRIKKEFPNIKTILFRRKDKEKHAHSIFKIMKQNGDIHPRISFEEYKKVNPHYLVLSDHDKRTIAYEKEFEENLKIFYLEDFSKNLKASLEEIESFLGLDHFEYDFSVGKHEGSSFRGSYFKYYLKKFHPLWSFLKLNRIYQYLFRDNKV